MRQRFQISIEATGFVAGPSIRPPASATQGPVCRTSDQQNLIFQAIEEKQVGPEFAQSLHYLFCIFEAHL